MALAPKLNGTLKKFILRQKLFFVGTAAADGRVNISPKGLDSLRILSDNHIQWMSLTGSGNETAAHLKQTSRMTLMFCAFDGDAMILRVYGKAGIYHPDDPEWDQLAARFPSMAGARQIFDLNIDLVQTSCGTGVPIYQYAGERGEIELLPFYDEMGPDGVRKYWLRKNAVSIDGKPTGITGS